MSYPPTPQSPRVPVPKGAWDCHMHVFGPPDRFPFADAGAYAPPVADRAVHRRAMDALGFDRALLIQPSLYGSDHAALLDALAKGGGRLLGIGSCPATIGEEGLAALARQGIIGLRFVGMSGPGGGPYPGTQGLDQFALLKSRMRAFGMQVHVWADLDTCITLAEEAAGNGMPMVLDHLAGLTPADLPGTNRFDRLAAALSSGTVWIKLAFLRRSALPGEYGDMQHVVAGLAEAAPDRVVWGSDWPFVRLDLPPEPAFLIDRLHHWLGEDLFVRCLRDNPEALAGGTGPRVSPEALAGQAP